MVNLIEQEIGMNQLDQAKLDIALLKKKEPTPTSKTKDNIEWLDYLMLRNKAFKAKLNTKKRIVYLQALRSRANNLLNAELGLEQFKKLANDMMAIGKPQFSLIIYKQLLAHHQLTTPEELATGGNIAMQNNAQQDSSAFYWAAYQMAAPDDKKKYALAAIKALWAGNFVNQAVTLADQLPVSLIQDRATLIYLSQLALAANQAQIAEKYMLEALSLTAKKKNE